MTEDEMVGQCHQSDQHEFGPAPGGSGRQEGLACSSPLVLNLGLLRSFGLQLPEAFTISCPDWGFWELQFKSIRITKVKNH